ncbi:Zn-ribbon domain-containing OB-fold protein [Actinomadura bangladeshensis]|uniref:DNA-binding protein n=1 Tax=Actinomadura bangladeshensis TaxID=453573 RepID=A0A4V2XP22_9ACTN|nr:OB-fold domain-containing protein [Actinomadura bangladeshensis]TDC20376.1 DNA-binding protein [Actinomadura bangladeshensis]
MTQPEELSRPVPVPDDASAAYWAGAQEHRLVIMRCRDCAFYVHPPRAVCPRCQQETLVGEEVSGRGTVYSYHVMHLPGVPGFTPPYAVAVVELAEQPGLFAVGNVLDCPPEEIVTGMRVRVTFEELPDSDMALPQWSREKA